jgi:hypothetical protein
MKSVRVAAAWMIVAASFVVLILLFAAGQPFMTKAQEPKRFQYRIVEVIPPDTQNMQTTLNEFGTSGWELVAVSMGDLTAPRLIFKK